MNNLNKYLLIVFIIFFIYHINTYEYLDNSEQIEWYCDPNKPEKCIKLPDGIIPDGLTFSDTNNGDYGEKQKCNEYCWNNVNDGENIISYNCSGRECIIVEEGDPQWDVNTNYLDVPNNLWGNKVKCELDCQEGYPNYKCNQVFGTCSEDVDGEYKSLEECDEDCGDNKFARFSCDNNTGVCINDEDGKYYTKASCEEECEEDYTLYWIIGGIIGGVAIFAFVAFVIYITKYSSKKNE